MIVKRKMFFVWSMKKEKAWLEAQAKQGLVLVKLGLFKYYFEESDPQDLVYQFDFQVLSKDKEEDYLDLFQEWMFVARYGGWYYFYKPDTPGERNDIYMNNTSKQSMFRRLLGFLFIVAFPLYYQLIFMFPRMDPQEFEYPSFYFFMRIIVVLFLALWLYAVIRIFFIARQFRSNVRE